MKEIEGKIREVLDSYKRYLEVKHRQVDSITTADKPQRYCNQDQALSVILSLVRGEIPEKKKNAKSNINEMAMFIFNRGYNQSLSDLHKKFGQGDAK